MAKMKADFEDVLCSTLGEAAGGMKGTKMRIELDENKDFLEASFLVEFENFQKLSQARTALQQMNESIQINFLDQKGII